MPDVEAGVRAHAAASGPFLASPDRELHMEAQALASLTWSAALSDCLRAASRVLPGWSGWPKPHCCPRKFAFYC